jgi:hypothetical protein
MWASLSVAECPFAGFFENCGSCPKLCLSGLSVQGSGCAFHRRPQIAKPVDRRTTIVRGPDNTITVLIDKLNIMLSFDSEPSSAPAHRDQERPVRVRVLEAGYLPDQSHTKCRGDRSVPPRPHAGRYWLWCSGRRAQLYHDVVVQNGVRSTPSKPDPGIARNQFCARVSRCPPAG